MCSKPDLSTPAEFSSDGPPGEGRCNTADVAMALDLEDDATGARRALIDVESDIVKIQVISRASRSAEGNSTAKFKDGSLTPLGSRRYSKPAVALSIVVWPCTAVFYIIQ